MSVTDPTRSSEPPGPSDSSAEPDGWPPLNRTVFFTSATVVTVFACWALVAPHQAADAVGSVRSTITTWFGWWYFLLASVLVLFVIALGTSKLGTIRLGPEQSRPEFSLFSWTAMLFAAGIGIDLMFFSVAEPVSQYLSPPTGAGGNEHAAKEAVSWTLFHYGITGWAMYAVMGMTLAYFAFRRGLPLSIRSALYPIIGRRIHGGVGDAVDTAAVLGTIFGVATSLGIGIVQLNFGLKMMFGVPEGKAAQMGLIVLSVIMATASAVSGLDKGIRRLSELNVLLSVLLMLFVLFAGDTPFLLNALVMNVGDYVSGFAGKTMDTMAWSNPRSWMDSWTMFFWAWWVAWSPFVGLFLARISRGRTIREFVFGVLVIPFCFILLWVSIFGNSALSRVVHGDHAFGSTTANRPEAGFYTFLDHYPWSPAVIGVATFTGLLYYVTSADSGSLVMGNFTSRLPHAMSDCAPWVRVFWSCAIGLLTLAMLFAGGGTSITTLTDATIVMGLPFSFVLALVAVGLFKALRRENQHSESLRYALPGAIAAGRDGGPPGQSISQRLRRAGSFPGRRATVHFLEETATPALAHIAQELRATGVEARTEPCNSEVEGIPGVRLVVDLADEPTFEYAVQPVAAPTPSFATSRKGTGDVYFRTEIHLRQGTQGYDLNGWSRAQIEGDVLDHYERHLHVLHVRRREAVGELDITTTSEGVTP